MKFSSIKTRISNWDKAISKKISEKSGNKKRFARLSAQSGNTLPWFLFSIVCFIFDKPINRIELLIQWLAMGATFLIVMLLKFTVRRKRPVDEIPPDLVGKHDFFSFPSGHAGRMSCLSIIMVLFFPAIGWIFLIWLLFVGYGRIATGVHYFVDIIGGTIIGGLIGSFFFIIRNGLYNLFLPFVTWVDSFLF